MSMKRTELPRSIPEINQIKAGKALNQVKIHQESIKKVT